MNADVVLRTRLTNGMFVVCLSSISHRDLINVLQSSTDGDIFWDSRAGDGRRGVHTSAVMRAVSDDLARRFPRTAASTNVQPRPLLLILWSDGTALTQRMSAHPVVLKVANVSPELYTKRVRA
jgi:hypothetical protein